MASNSLALKALWPVRWISTFADVMAPPRRRGWSSRRSACGCRFAQTLLAPFPVLSVGWAARIRRGPFPGSRHVRMGRGQDPTLRSLRRRHRRPPPRSRTARPQRTCPVRLPRSRAWSSGPPYGAAYGRLGTGRADGGGKRAQRGAVQTAARSGRRSSSGADPARAAATAGDLRRRGGRPRGRPPGRDLYGPGTRGEGLGTCRDRLPRRHQAVPQRIGSPLDRPVATAPGGGPASWPGVLRRCRPGPGRPGTGSGRGTRQAADRARTVSGDRAPDADGSARAERQRRGSTARLRAPASPAPGGTRNRAQPTRTGPLPTVADPGHGRLEPFGLGQDVLAAHVVDELRVQDAHVALRIPPELVVVVAPDDVPAHADDPQRHRRPPGSGLCDHFARSPAAQRTGSSRPTAS